MSKNHVLERLRKVLNGKYPEASKIINSLDSIDEFKDFCVKNISDEDFRQIEFQIGMSYLFDKYRVQK